MKKLTSIFVILLFARYTNAQGPHMAGMTSEGGTNGYGTLFQYIGGDTSLASVTSLSTGNPQNSTLIEAPDNLMYGFMQKASNTTDSGVIVAYNYPANTYSIKVSLTLSTGVFPSGGLLLAGDGKFYGLTYGGGANLSGTIISYVPGAGSVTDLLDLPISATPQGTLIEAADSLLYGISDHDGINNGGTIFSFNRANNTYDTLVSLPAFASPYGSLLQVGADTFYGLTYEDGTNNSGTLFRYTPSGGYIVLYNMPLHAYPHGSLIRAGNGLLYGLSYYDGSNASGTIFSYNIDSASYHVAYNFDGTSAYNPQGDLYQASDGKLYGMTELGGLTGAGALFSYDPASGTYTEEVDFSNTICDLPRFGHLTEYTGPLGIASSSACHLSLSPNPTTGSFTIQNNDPGPLSVNIISLLGEQLKTFTMSGSQQSFDISDLAAGIYEVQISDGEQVVKVMKVVKA